MKNENDIDVNGKLAGFLGNIERKVANTTLKASASVKNKMDKNGDGKIDLKDIGIDRDDVELVKEKAHDIARKAGDSVKQGGAQFGKAISEAMLEIDRKNLRPVFQSDLLPTVITSSTLAIASNPRVIRIVDRDKKRNDKEACQGEVGYLTTAKSVEILNIYEDTARSIGVWFYPNISKTIYYIDPFRANCYISLDEYFVYLRKARVNELTMIAKDLGAKKVRISLKEHKKTFVSKSVKESAKASKGLNSVLESGTYEKADNDISNVSIADEEEFSGHETPVQPQLIYFRNEADIIGLIEKRMDISKCNDLKSKTYTFQYNKSSGITEKEAAQLDAALSQMKCGGTATISSEAQQESRIDFEYYIEF